MNKHTPAPWKWMYWKDDDIVYNVKPVMRRGDGQIENKADAVLIAAAPELLEACERALEVFEIEHSESGAYQDYEGGIRYSSCSGCELCETTIPMLRAVIAKAVTS